MEVYYISAVLVPKMQEDNKHVVLQFFTYQRNFHMNFMAIARSLLRTDRKRWRNMMVSFQPCTEWSCFVDSGLLLLFKVELKIITVGFQSPINLRNADMEHMNTHLHLCMRRNMNIKVYLVS